MKSIIPELKPWQTPIKIVDLTQFCPTDRAYIAGRSCRTFKIPSAILEERSPYERKRWVHRWGYEKGHGMILEFRGAGLAFWFGGVSLRTRRDVLRGRLFSFLDISTRAKVFYRMLRVHLKALEPQEWPEIFYLIDKPTAQDVALLRAGCRCAIRHALIKGNPDNAGNYLPMALKGNFCMAGNARMFAEYLEKRACVQTGHPEYVYWARLLLQWLRDNRGWPNEWGNPCVRCEEKCEGSMA